MEKCSLPLVSRKDIRTDHCFTDGTHQTCCMVGKKARTYADNSGNPIGELAELASYILTNKKI